MQNAAVYVHLYAECKQCSENGNNYVSDTILKWQHVASILEKKTQYLPFYHLLSYSVPELDIKRAINKL